MTTHYVNKREPLLGSYQVAKEAQGYRWTWRETANYVEYVDHGALWHASEAAAWRDAADDWESNGNSSNGRLAGQMRATATRLEKEA